MPDLADRMDAAVAQPNGQPPAGPLGDEQERAVRLFRFLRDLTASRSRVVRDVNDYDTVLWLSDVPTRAGCAGPLLDPAIPLHWGEPWLALARPDDALPHPEPPAEFAALLAAPDIANPGWSPPDRAPLPPIDEDDPAASAPVATTDNAGPDAPDAPGLDAEAEAARERERIKAEEERAARWQRFVADWGAWAADERERRAARDAYAALFGMHTRQLRLGEQFEVVVGFGLLSWRTPSGQQVRRHLLTAPAEVAFDAATGAVSIVPADDEDRLLALEQEMVEGPERPAPETQRRIEDDLLPAIPGADDARPALHEALSIWANAAAAEGRFLDQPTPAATTSAPQVAFAPAIVLRKRGDRSLLTLFEHVIADLEAGTPAPLGIRRIVAEIDDAAGADGIPTADLPPVPAGDAELFFPLPANEEQRQIAQRLATRQGVLVQGPPGTGKSHTIANLVSHLLATNQRVLITSHTARALAVLHDKLPEEIRGLCVSVLGNDRAAYDHLERVVLGITDRFERWHAGGAADSDERVAGLTRRLDALRREEAMLAGALRDRRERDAAPLPAPIGTYAGTPTDVARQTAGDAPALGWLNDAMPTDADPPLTAEAFAALIALVRDLPPADDARFDRAAPSLADLLLPEAFADLAQAEEAAAMALAAAHNAAANGAEARRALSGLAADQRAEVTRIADAALAGLRAVAADGRGWVASATADVAAGHGAPWEVLATESERLLAAVGTDAPPEIAGLDGRDPRIVRADAADLRRHLDEGGDLGFGPFRPAPVKRGKYLLDETLVGGERCTTASALARLIGALDAERALADLTALWAPVDPVPPGPFGIRRIDLLARSQGLILARATGSHLADLRRAAAAHGLPASDSIDAAAIEALLAAAAAADAESRLTEAEAPIAAIERMVAPIAARPDAHPASGALLAAIRRRTPDVYAAAHAALADHAATRERLAERDRLLGALRAAAPTLAADLAVTAADPAWDERPAAFAAAWDRARARAWVRERATGDGGDETAALDAVRDGIQRTLGELAAERAWRSCLNGMGERERRALSSWQKTMAKLRGGHSKYAAQYRAQAREHLEVCRRAIPAWVMPLYRVAETLRPEPGLFDVAIIDEASQSGPEALFLNYIAKRIVVVGDDKQISPDNVGLNRENVFALRDRHLRGIPQADSLGMDHSYFDVSDIRFGGRITLREHFRCMPEIIRFSNEQFYDGRLVPLRQYGFDRLPPLRAVHVPDGYERGDENPPEAEAIVERILECCADPAYAGLTMGVISLRGPRQAQKIESLLLAAMDEGRIDPKEIEERRIVCGDAYAFQGDDRDVIFLSMVTALRDRKIAARTDAATQRRFNVAASRARDQMWLFHSVSPADLGPSDLRGALLRAFVEPAAAPDEDEAANDLFESDFEREVCRRIRARGYRVTPQVRVGPYRIDLVVEGAGARLAVECDGDHWHGPEHFDRDQARQRVLERSGWTFWRVRGGAFYLDPEEALGSLWPLLDRLGIMPGTAVSALGDNGSASGPTLLRATGDVALPDASVRVPEPGAAATPTPDGAQAASMRIATGKTDARPAEPADRMAVEIPAHATVAESPGSAAAETHDLSPMGRVEAAEPGDNGQLPLLPESQLPDDGQDAGSNTSPANGRPPTALPTYQAWPSRSVADPIRDRDRAAMDLLDIIATEGPMVVRRAFRLYARALRRTDFDAELKSSLNSIIFLARSTGRLRVEDELGKGGQIDAVVRVPAAPPVLPRLAGPRAWDEIPPSEIVAACRLAGIDPARFAAGDLDAAMHVLPLFGRTLGDGTDPSPLVENVAAHLRAIGEA